MTAPAKSNLILMAEDDSDDRLLAQDALAESGLALTCALSRTAWN